MIETNLDFMCVKRNEKPSSSDFMYAIKGQEILVSLVWELIDTL